MFWQLSVLVLSEHICSCQFTKSSSETCEHTIIDFFAVFKCPLQQVQKWSCVIATGNIVVNMALLTSDVWTLITVLCAVKTGYETASLEVWLIICYG